MPEAQARSATAARVGLLLARAVSAGVSPGAVAAWRVGEGETSIVTVGEAVVRPTPQPATAHTLYDLASLSKPLATTTLTLLGVRGGYLTLDTTVATHLAELRDTAVAGLTVVQLLTHTAGLPPWAPIYALTGGETDRVVRVLAEMPVTSDAPAVYSDVGFILLGLVVERALGEPLASAFRARVAAPLGVADELAYGPDPAAIPLAGGAAVPGTEARRLAADTQNPATIPPWRPGLPDDGNARFLGGVAGHAGLFGTAGAVLRVAAEYLPGGGSLLNADEAAMATRAWTPPGEQVRALGWQLAATPGCSAGPALGHDACGHVGFTGTSVWLEPRRRALLVLLANRHHPGHREDIDLHPLRRRFHALVLGQVR